jgi:flagella basal body P-ring formation protein FlgA
MLRRVWRGFRLLAMGAAWTPRLWSQSASPVATTAAVPVAARALDRGVALTRDDIAADALPPVAADRITGWVTQRVVRAGEPLRAPAIAPAALVVAGTPVTVEAVTDGVRLTRAGTAMTAGALGATVRVRLDARRSVLAVVTGPSQLRLP